VRVRGEGKEGGEGRERTSVEDSKEARSCKYRCRNVCILFFYIYISFWNTEWYILVLTAAERKSESAKDGDVKVMKSEAWERTHAACVRNACAVSLSRGVSQCEIANNKNTT